MHFEFGGLIFRGACFQNFTVVGCSRVHANQILTSGFFQIWIFYLFMRNSKFSLLTFTFFLPFSLLLILLPSVHRVFTDLCILPHQPPFLFLLHSKIQGRKTKKANKSD